MDPAYVLLGSPLTGPIVLVPHSNAGLYAPGLAERFDVEATVYVDAALPLAEPDTPLAPPGMLETLRDLADEDGVLPPWSRWWPEAEVAVPTGWADRPSAYLAFGDTYADEVDRASALGWPVSVMAGRHLHQLHDPAGVAAEITRVAAAVTA